MLELVFSFPMTQCMGTLFHPPAVQASLAAALERAETADRLLAETKGEVQHLKEKVDLLTEQAEEEKHERAAQAVQLEDVRVQLQVHMLSFQQ